ncbi:hypothetical protein FQ775_23900 [Nitratireductor mangrovi]|uniref:Uncharacterized protein n=1 Tax=Nitratireductor mangrovi TaxID=2599600 RepID=A0A6H0DXC8_9HYPH|nr:hypothetical protein [Nitratireductor mangrovi]QIS94649.1 hypothetical protein FQ775_23900 [Nitratireductor mangrovi]
MLPLTAFEHLVAGYAIAHGKAEEKPLPPSERAPSPVRWRRRLRRSLADATAITARPRA